MKIQEPPSSPGYGAYSTITAIPNVDVESYFSIKSSNNVDLVMNTIVTEAQIQFKETSLTLTDSDEIFVGSGLIYCTDFQMWQL